MVDSLELEITDIESDSDEQQFEATPTEELPINLPISQEEEGIMDIAFSPSTESNVTKFDDDVLVDEFLPDSVELHSEIEDVVSNNAAKMQDGEESVEKEVRSCHGGMEDVSPYRESTQLPPAETTLMTRAKTLLTYHDKKLKKLAMDRILMMRQKSRNHKMKCKVCELEYSSQFHRKRHLKTLLHQEGVISRKVGTNGEVTFDCSLCQREFPLLTRLVSHKKVCPKLLNDVILTEIESDAREDEEMKPVVVDMEFDLMETEQQLKNREEQVLCSTDQSSILVDTVEKTQQDNNDDYCRPKRASRLLAEQKLLDLNKSKSNDTSSNKSSDFEDESDFGESYQEETDGETEDDEIDLTSNGEKPVATLKLGKVKKKESGKGFSHKRDMTYQESSNILHEQHRQPSQELGKDQFQLQKITPSERKKLALERRKHVLPDGIKLPISQKVVVDMKIEELKNYCQFRGNSITCLICQKELKHIGRFRNHLLTHIKRSKAKFATQMHDELALSSEKYRCDICFLSYLSEKQLAKHLSSFLHLQMEKCKKVSETGVVIYACNRCEEKFDLLQEFLSHKRDIHSKEEFFCEPCNRNLSGHSNFRDHLLSYFHVRQIGGQEAVWDMEKQKKHTCSTCDKNYMKAKQLREHILTHTKPQFFVCEICGKKLSSSSSLKNHLKTHTAVPKPKAKPNRLIEKPIKCKKCPKRFVNERKMYHHLKMCGTGFTCDLCYKVVGSLQLLWEHTNRVHLGKKKKQKTNKNAKFTCEICPKTTTTKNSLMSHMELKHFSNMGSCPYGCSDKIENADEWKLHLESCNSEKITEQSKCSCYYCGEIFRTRLLQFDHHLRIHKSHPCEFCSRIFTKPTVLRSHQYEHEEAKAFLCPKCGKRYRTAYNLRLHSTTVCGDDEAAKEELIRKRRGLHRIFREKAKPFKCDICSKGFIEERRLEAHKRKVHQNQDEGSESENKESPLASDDEA